MKPGYYLSVDPRFAETFIVYYSKTKAEVYVDPPAYNEWIGWYEYAKQSMPHVVEALEFMDYLGEL